MKKWTEREKAYLRKAWGKASWEQLKKNLPGRSMGGIQNKATVLKLVRRNWSIQDVKRLEQLYPKAELQDLLDAFPGKTLNALKCKASLQGITRVRIDQKEDGRLQGGSWPGMDGGRFAYDLSKEEWERSPDEWHNIITSKGYKFALMCLCVILLQGCVSTQINPWWIFQEKHREYRHIEHKQSDISTFC